MNLTLHIFKKDARHLYPEILIALVFTVAFAWVAPMQWLYAPYGLGASAGYTAAVLAPLLRIFLPVIWLVLIVRLVQDESLVGDRQFWVTRPYRWPELLAAKVLFLLVFLYVPLVTMQCYLLHHAGLNVRAALPDLLFYQLRLAAIYILPTYAIATVTATFARQFVTMLAGLAYLGIVAALEQLWMGARAEVPEAGAVLLGLVAVVLVAVVLLQYARRWTRVSRLTLAGLPLLVLLVDAGLHARGWMERDYPAVAAGGSETAAVMFDPNPLRQPPRGSGAPIVNGGGVVLSLPVELHGLPAGTRLKATSVAIEVTAGDGFRWSLPYVMSGVNLRAGVPYSMTSTVDVAMPLEIFERVGKEATEVSVSLAVERLQPDMAETAIAREPGFATPGRGVCTVRADGMATDCLYPLRLPSEIDVSAQVLDKPCDDAAGANRMIVRTFLGGDQNGVAYDFDPVAKSGLTFQLPPVQGRAAGQGTSSPSRIVVSAGMGRSGYLCPGASVTMTPQVRVRRERYSFRQPGVMLEKYVRRLGVRMEGPGVVQGEQD